MLFLRVPDSACIGIKFSLGGEPNFRGGKTFPCAQEGLKSGVKMRLPARFSPPEIGFPP
jgi:hypothetical protein